MILELIKERREVRLASPLDIEVDTVNSCRESMLQRRQYAQDDLPIKHGAAERTSIARPTEK